MPSARGVLDQAEVVQVTADALGTLTVVRQVNGYSRPPAYLQSLLPRGEQARRQQAGTGVGCGRSRPYSRTVSDSATSSSVSAYAPGG